MGVSDAERAQAQDLLVSVDLELAGEHYPPADELGAAANYADIVRAADESARHQPYRLLETYVLRVARELAERWPDAERVRVAATKSRVPVLPQTDEANVEVCLVKAAGRA